MALLSGLPVLRLDWPEDRLPITQRRAVQKALAPTALEHLLCYVTQDGRQAAFVWARRRGDRKVELRTLPYEVGAPARTTVERLGKLAFTVQDLGLYGEPGIGPLTDRLNGAFDVQAVTDDFFGQYQRCFEEEVKPAVRKVLPDEAEAHAFTQILFNRLMFCWFLQKKGWLSGGRTTSSTSERPRHPASPEPLPRLPLLPLLQRPVQPGGGAPQATADRSSRELGGAVPQRWPLRADAVG